MKEVIIDLNLPIVYCSMWDTKAHNNRRDLWPVAEEATRVAIRNKTLEKSDEPVIEITWYTDHSRAHLYNVVKECVPYMQGACKVLGLKFTKINNISVKRVVEYGYNKSHVTFKIKL